MRAFIVRLDNQPGSLADLAQAIGEKGVNISGIAATTWEATGAIGLVTNDDAGTRRVLEERGLDYRDCELVSVSLEDRPGALGDVARRLAERGVNIDLVLPTGTSGQKVTVALGVDDPSGAREALGDMVATGAQAI